MSEHSDQGKIFTQKENIKFSFIQILVLITWTNFYSRNKYWFQ